MTIHYSGERVPAAKAEAAAVIETTAGAEAEAEVGIEAGVRAARAEIEVKGTKVAKVDSAAKVDPKGEAQAEIGAGAVVQALAVEAKAEIGTDAGVRVHAVEGAIEAKVTRAIGVDSLAEAEPGAKAQTEVGSVTRTGAVTEMRTPPN